MLAEFCLKLSPRGAIVAAGAALIVFSFGCDDPSSAGLELVDDDGARPVALVEDPTRAEQGELRDETGGSDRVLAGTVDDPVSGTVSALAYVDFTEPLTPTSAFRTGPVDSLILSLKRDYLYGDSLGSGTLTLHEMDDEWPSAAVPADSDLVAGALVTSVPFAATDVSISIPMPDAWVSANEEKIRMAGSDTLFHGFQISVEGTNSVVGFDISESALRVVSGGETLEFPISRRLTTGDRLTPTAAPAGSLLMQDTAGPGIAMEFDLTDNDLAAAIINHGEIRVTVDTVAFVNNQPVNFARPPVGRLELQVLANTGAIFVLETAPVRNGTVTFSSDLLRSAMQGLAEDVGTVDHFRISVDRAENGFGAIVLRGPTVDGAPVAEIIYSKLK